MNMDNSGNGPLRVPGFSGISVRYGIDPEQGFAHGSCAWKQDPRLTAREIAMVGLMDSLTDKEDWHVKIFDQDAVEIWRQESVSRPLISQRAWDWCVAELQDKAATFTKLYRVMVLDTGSCVCKSDALVDEFVATGLKAGVIKIQEQFPDKTVTRTIASQLCTPVDPTMFPLVYSRTTVLTEGGQVRIDKPFESYSRGQIASEQRDEPLDLVMVERNITDIGFPYGYYTDEKFQQWSLRFQCLPCEVEFNQASGNSVRITSYINNLPPRHESLYHTIERLIEVSIEPWNACLIKGRQLFQHTLTRRSQSGRVPMRIRTYGPLWERNDYPEWGRGRKLEALEKDKSSEAYRAARKKVREYLELASNSNNGPGEEKYWLGEEDGIEDWDIWGIGGFLHTKWQEKHRVAHPEPGTAFSYEDWKAGKNGRAIVGRTDHSREELRSQIPPDLDHEFYEVWLQESFREQGLQVIVKIESIELDPASPSFGGADWTFPAQLNEHIVATSVYYYDVQNITESRLSFRQATRMDIMDYVYWEGNRERKTNDTEALAETFGCEYDGEACIAGRYQELGSVSTHQGRFLAWPNVLQYRVEPFTLLDPSREGHRRYIVLYLVDPNYRIASTRNVPPQQHDWWAEAALAAMNKTSGGETRLPEELVGLIDTKTKQWPMGAEEAKVIKGEAEQDQQLAFRAVERRTEGHILHI